MQTSDTNNYQNLDPSSVRQQKQYNYEENEENDIDEKAAQVSELKNIEYLVPMKGKNHLKI